MLVGLPLASCSDGVTDPGKPIAPASPNRDGKVGSTGNSAKSGSIDVRVLLDSKGGAFVEFRTGTFNDATGLPLKPATTDGYFTKIQYKVNNASGKQIFVRNITFSKTGIGYYAEPLNLCAASDDDDDDDDKSSSCGTKYDKGYTVVTQANLKGVGGDGSATDVVRDENAAELYYGDVKLSDQPVYLVTGTTRTSLATASVPLGLQTYQVDFPNLSAPAPAAGVQTQCLVFLDGSFLPQIPNLGSYVNPNGFAYVGNSSPFVGAGTTSNCTFTLNLTGTHKIIVTALPLVSGDYNVLNNSTASFTIAPHAVVGPLDVAVGSIQRLVGSPATPVSGDTVTAGVTGQFSVPVSATGVIPAGGTVVTCTVSVGNPTTPATTSTFQSSTTLTSAAPSGVCLFANAFALVGTYTISVTASSPAEAAAQAGNNTASASYRSLAAPPSADLYVSAILQKDAVTGNFVPLSSVHVGVVTSFQATIALQNGNVGAADVTVTCTVKTGSTVVAPQIVHLSTGTSASCPFTYKPTNTTDTPQLIGVTLSAPSVLDRVAVNDTLSGTVQALVRADMKVAMVAEQPAVLGKTSTVTVNVTNQEPVGGTSSNVSCKLSFPGLAAIAATISGPTPSNMTVAPGQTLPCTFAVTFTAGAGSVGTAVVPALASLTTNGAADDRLTDNNVNTDVFTNTGGTFNVTYVAANAREEWLSPDAGGTNVESVQFQDVKVDQLALLVLPSQAVLGDFELTGTISSSATIDHTNGNALIPGNVVFESGRVTGSLLRDQCNVAPGEMLTDASHPHATDPAHVSISAVICGRPAIDPVHAGMQEITVSYTRSLPTGVVLGAPGVLFSDPMWAGQLTLAIRLGYRLSSQPATAPMTFVTATIQFDASQIRRSTPPVATGWYNKATSPSSITTP